MPKDRKIQKSSRTFAILSALALTVLADTAAAADRIGRFSELPLPRFAALKDDKVNMRVGPGQDYAIKWELRRRHMPVRVIGEHGPWRRVELVDGDRGWIHRALLTARRYAVAAGDSVELYAQPEPTARMVARAPAATPVKVLECAPAWCRTDADGKRGWAPKRNLWGVEIGEVFD